MKKVTLYILSSLVSISVYAQENNTGISYGEMESAPSSLKNLTRNKVVNTKISLEDTVLYGNKTIQQLYELEKQNQITERRRRIDHLRFGFSAGYSHQIAPIPRDLPDEAKKRRKHIRNGVFGGADIAYFFNHNIGVGMKYSYYWTKNTEENFTYTRPDQTVFTGTLSDNVHIHYTGPFVTLRSVVRKNKVFANCDLSMGCTWYRNRLKENSNSNTITGSNFGFVSTIGVDFMLGLDSSIGVNFNISAASIKKVKINDFEYTLDDNNVENLSRIGLGLIYKIYR